MGAFKNRRYRLTDWKKQLGLRQLYHLGAQPIESLPFRLDQVPEISMEIGENRNRAIGFMTWRFTEFDALFEHRRMVAGKVVGFEEQEHAAAGLVADAFF